MSLFSAFPIFLKFHAMELQTVMLKANNDLTSLDMNSYYYFFCMSVVTNHKGSINLEQNKY